MKIKILKDTPMDRKGTILSLAEFELRYSNSTKTNVFEILDNKYANEFFEIQNEHNPPLDFIFEGFVHRKEYDGCYHKYHAGVPFIKENSISALSVPEAEYVVKKAKFRKPCLYLANSANFKL